MNCQEYKEIISAHVDATLSPAEESKAQSHLNRCPECSQTFAWETKATKILRQSLSPLTPRQELKQRLLDQLGQANNESQSWLWASRAWVPAFLILLITGSVYLVWPLRNQQDFFADTVSHYQRAHRDLTNLSQTAGTDPTARILDLKPWGYHLLGKSIQRTNGRENRVFVYHGQQNDLLLAQEVEGASLSPPRGSTVVTKSGKNFVSLRSGNVNLVAWQDNNIVCVLASQLPRDRVIALAEQIAIRS